MSKDKKESQHQTEEPPPYYGTFQGVVNHPPPTAFGFPQPVPPPGVSESPPSTQSQYYDRGYQTVPGYAVVEGRSIREHRLPCCGCGVGWFCFIIGFFIAAIPWYIAAIILMCSRNIDPREKPGYVACTIAAVLTAIAAIFGLTRIG
ncbi:large ribosomal subunit protein eL20z-like [Primulina huaijiensis]|uniref:large ribosomal subunit protein eL20z-like n=1 Tax=Primulina huaijiensis TaxID=1492673 RepID=UPI003CC6F6DF